MIKVIVQSFACLTAYELVPFEILEVSGCVTNSVKAPLDVGISSFCRNSGTFFGLLHRFFCLT